MELLRGTASWTFVPLGLFPFLAELALKAGIVVMLAAAVSWRLSRKSAATRHVLWTGAFVAMLLLPLLVATSFDWRIVPNPRIPAEPSIGIRVVERGVQPTEALVGRGVAKGRTGVPTPAAHPRPAIRNATRWLAELWLLGFLGIAARYAVGTTGIRRWKRTGRELSGDQWSTAVASAGKITGSTRRARLFETTSTAVPMVWGWREPLVFLPPAASAWDEERRSMTLAHELAHVKRGDVLIEALVQLVCAVFWFHPAVWYAARRLRLERECACDGIVLEGGAKPSVYGRHLMAVADEAQAQAPPPIVAMCMARKHDLSQRLETLLDVRAIHTSPTRRVRVIIAAALAGCVLVLGPLGWRTPMLRATAPERASLVFDQANGAPSPRLIFAGSDVEARRLIDSIRQVRKQTPSQLTR